MDQLGTKLAAALLARGCTEADLEILAESTFAADRAAHALQEVVEIMRMIARKQSGKSDPTCSDIRAALDLAGLHGNVEYQLARAAYGRRIHRRHVLDLMG
ncbi:hypothetical protein HYV74_04155 [Candidatus Uhrbacteria bacterium]|nr:hypothetical protein [Candidatus Uhrbacteria bacterium]